MTLRLMPILEHMGACHSAKDWLRRNDFATFAEAWDACATGGWMDFVVSRLSPGNAEASELVEGYERGSLVDYYAPHVDRVERWFVEYAHKHGCAVEVSS